MGLLAHQLRRRRGTVAPRVSEGAGEEGIFIGVGQLGWGRLTTANILPTR
jgi:hypothetical protein